MTNVAASMADPLKYLWSESVHFLKDCGPDAIF